MLSRTLTKHASQRMQQRGWTNKHLDIFLEVASLVEPETYLLTDQDAQDAIKQRKREIQIIGRLKGKKVAVVGETVVTCCHSCAADQKRILRRGRSSI